MSGICPRFREARVRRGGNDVVIASHDQRLLCRQMFIAVLKKPVHPTDFISVVVGIDGVAVGHVDAGHSRST